MQQKNNETQEKYDYNFKLMSGGKDGMIIVWTSTMKVIT